MQFNLIKEKGTLAQEKEWAQEVDLVQANDP